MAKKKTDETDDTVVETAETQALEETALEAKAHQADAPVEAKPKKAAKKNAEEHVVSDDPSIAESVIETVTSAAGAVVETVTAGASAIVSAITGSTDEDQPVHKGKRAEKIGVVTSDKMTLTVVVRVDRLVKHPIYRKYVRKRKKFMAHDDKGAKIGDKVRIVETRPLSARKRWRVVEIIQKAEL